MNDNPSPLAVALAELQTKLPEIRKSETAEVQTKTGAFAYSYTYANLAGISAVMLPLLGGLGLSFIAKPTFNGEQFVLACSLLHVSGERENAEYPLPASGTPQALGSAITYGRRYCLCAMTGVAPEGDDDGATAEAEASSRRGTAQRATPRQRQEPRSEKQAPRTQARASAPPPLPGEDPDAITAAQLTKLAILVKEVGLDQDRDTYLARLATITGREVQSSKTLTKAEAHQVITELQLEASAPEEAKP